MAIFHNLKVLGEHFTAIMTASVLLAIKIDEYTTIAINIYDFNLSMSYIEIQKLVQDRIS